MLWLMNMNMAMGPTVQEGADTSPTGLNLHAMRHGQSLKRYATPMIFALLAVLLGR